MLRNGLISCAIVLIGFAIKVQAGLSVKFEDAITHAIVKLEVGENREKFDVIMDTGSANTWIGADKEYDVTLSNTIEDTGSSVEVYYGSGIFRGHEWLEAIHLGKASFKQSIGIASYSTGFDTADGILGLGPQELTEGTLADPQQQISTVSFNIFDSRNSDSETITISHRKLIFGEPKLLRSNIVYAPITTTAPAAKFWGIDAGFQYGDTAILSSTAGIVDHGTTLILLASDAFNKFMASTGARFDYATGLPMATESQCADMEPLYLDFGGKSIKIPVSEYRWPANKNEDIGGKATQCYLAVNDIGTPSGQGLDFIIGYHMLKRWTVVLDKANHGVGIATAGSAE